MKKIFLLLFSLLLAITTCHAFDAGDGGGMTETTADELFLRLDSSNDTEVSGTMDWPISQFTVGGSTFVVVKGSVGIGVSNPLATLHVNQNGHTGGIWSSTGAVGNNYIRILYNSLGGGIDTGAGNLWFNPAGGIGSFYDSTDDFIFRIYSGTIIKHQLNSAGDSYMMGGNVGIGITNPTEKLHVVGSATFTGAVNASTFNATGSEYQVNGVKVIDGSRNIYAASLRVSTSADCSVLTPDSLGQICTEDDECDPLWVSTGTSVAQFAALELHRTNDSEGSGEMFISSGNVTETVVSVSSTMYPVAGTVTSGYDNHNFSVVTSSLVYTGISTHTFICIGDLNGCVVNAKDVSYAMTFSKNGVVITASYNKTTISKENFNEHISTTKKISLTTGDTVNVNVCNVNTTANILVNSMIVNCFQVD